MGKTLNINIYVNIENNGDVVIVDDANKVLYLDSLEEAKEVRDKIRSEWERMKKIN